MENVVSMESIVSTLLLAILLFASMILFSEVGRRAALRRNARHPNDTTDGLGIVDGAVFSLLGLVIAFTFAGAVSRLDTRRNQIVEEANTIGTAYLRINLLSEQDRPAMREMFRRYLDSRISAYRKFPDVAAVGRELENGKRLQAEMWLTALSSARDSQSATMLLVPALNQMFDITSTRTMAMLEHPPSIIFAMLFGLALISALLAGYGMAKSGPRRWLHTVGFAAVTAITFYVILDIEFPRFGFIRVDGFDRALVELRASMT